jgi:hypothetical protein
MLLLRHPVDSSGVLVSNVAVEKLAVLLLVWEAPASIFDLDFP